MERRQFIVSSSVIGVSALAGCSGDSGTEESGSDEGGSQSEDSSNDESDSSQDESPSEEQRTLTHELGESFTVGDGAQSIQYTVNDYSTIEDYIGSGPDLGSTPDGIFLVVNLAMENVGDKTIDISTNFLKLTDQEDRTFDADTEAGIYADQDQRISADPITFDQLQPGLSVTRAVIFDVPSGTYRFAAEPAGIFSNADTHYVPLGDVSSEETQEGDTQENIGETQEKESVRDVIETHFRANENEERNLLISTLHPESDIYESTINASVQLWNNYNLNYDYTIHSIEIDGEVAEVELTQETTGSSANFRDNRVRATWEFRKYQTQWRLYNTTTETIDYID